MCYWVGTKNVRDEMLRRLQKEPDNEIAQLFYMTFVGQSALSFMEYYVAIGKAGPRLSVLLNDQEKGLIFKNYRWGLDWNYTDGKTGKSYTRQLINSTCEKAFFVHKDVIYSQRCVIMIDGYYEFFHFARDVYPHFLKPVEGVFFAAGVWSEQADRETGEITAGFSLLTTPPNTMAKKLHNNPKAPNGARMLLLLSEKQVMDYLDPATTKEDLQRLFQPYPDSLMEAYPTARFLKKEFADRLNTEDVRVRIDYPELAFA
jgi:putative SOS response-associated peptidase YedK